MTYQYNPICEYCDKRYKEPGSIACATCYEVYYGDEKEEEEEDK